MAIDLSKVAGAGPDPVQLPNPVACSVKSTPYDFIVRELTVDGQVVELGDQSLPSVPHALSLAAAQQAVEEQAQTLQYTASVQDAADFWAGHIGCSTMLQACDFAFNASSAVFQGWAHNSEADAHAQAVRAMLASAEPHAPVSAASGGGGTSGETDASSASDSFSLPLTGTDIGTDKDARRTARRALAILFPHLDVALAADSREAGATYTQVVLKASRQAAQLARLLPSHDSWSLLAYLSKGDSESQAAEGTCFTLPDEKSSRKTVIDFLRKSFRQLKLVRSVEDANGSSLQFVRFQAKQAQGGRKRGRAGGVEGGADAAARVAPSTWLHFNLQKSGLEQMTVMNDIAKRCGGALWEVAGIKDKHGVTLQRACLRGVQPTQLLAAMKDVQAALSSSSARHHMFPESTVALPSAAQDLSVLDVVTPVAVGGLSLHTGSLQAGDQGGNAFSITLRQRELPSASEGGVQKPAEGPTEQLQRVLEAQLPVCGVSETCDDGYDESLVGGTLTAPPSPATAVAVAVAAAEGILRASMQQLASTGFTNFFGHQRVGAGFMLSGFAAPELGAATFRFDFDQLLHRALMGRPLRSESSPDNQLGILWAANWRNHIDKKLDLQRDQPRPHRGFISQMLKSCPGSCGTQKAVLAAAKKANTWDLALLDIPQAHRKIWMHGYQSLVWNRMAVIRRGMATDAVLEGDLVALGVDGCGLDAWTERAARPSALQAATERTSTTKGRWDIHVVTAAEAAAGKFSISHVVLPIPGAGVLYPQHALGEAYMKHLWQDQTHAALWPTVAAGMRLQRLSVAQRDAIAVSAGTAVREIVRLGHAGPAADSMTESLDRAASSGSGGVGEVFETAFGDISLSEDAIASAAALETKFGAIRTGWLQLQPRASSKLTADIEPPKWLAAASKGGYRHLIVKPAATGLCAGPVPTVSLTPSVPADIQAAANKVPASESREATTEFAAIASFSLPPGSYATVFLSTLTGGGAWETSVRR